MMNLTKHQFAICVVALLALFVSGCSKAKEGDAAKIEGEVATDAELKPITDDGILARTDAPKFTPKFTPKVRPVEPVKVVKQYPPESAYRKDAGVALKPKLIALPDPKGLLYRLSAVGAQRGTDFEYFAAAVADWRGLASDGTNVWIFVAFSLQANSYLFYKQPGPGNPQVPGQNQNSDSLFGLYTITPATGQSKFEVLPVRPAAPVFQANHQMSQLAVIGKAMFLVNGNQLIRRNLTTGQQQAIPIAGGAMKLNAVNGKYLIAISPDSVLKIDPETMKIDVLASTRRSPAVHALDSATAYILAVWPGKQESLRLMTKNGEIFEIEPGGQTARKLATLIGLAGDAVQVDSTGAYFVTGSNPSAVSVYRLNANQNELTLAFVTGSMFNGSVPAEFVVDGAVQPKWQSLTGFLPGMGSIANLPGGAAVFSFTGMAYFDANNAGAAVFPLQVPAIPATAAQTRNGFALDVWLTLNDSLVLLKTGKPFFWHLPFADFQNTAVALARSTPTEPPPHPLDAFTLTMIAGRKAAAQPPPATSGITTPEQIADVVDSVEAIRKNIDVIDLNHNLVIDGGEFHFVDLDRNGQISAEEAAMLREMNILLARRAVAKADKNADSKLDQHEIQKAMDAWLKLSPEEKIRYPRYDQMAAADRNQDGVLTVDEIADWQTDSFVKLHANLPAPVGPTRLSPAASQYDKNRNGVLDPTEVEAMKRDALRQPRK